jgi:ribose transport system permease protein
MDMQSAGVGSTRAFRLGDFLRDQLRNIAPFITLIVLVAFFSIASPSFATLGNLENILQQVSITAIMAVGLTFVILTAEIDLSVGAIANATAIVLTFFTL